MRTRTGQAPHWATIGGGVEEIGAQIKILAQIFEVTNGVNGGIAVQHIFLAKLAPVQFVDPTGPELSILERGGYALALVPFTAEGIAGVDPRPAGLAGG